MIVELEEKFIIEYGDIETFTIGCILSLPFLYYLATKSVIGSIVLSIVKTLYFFIFHKFFSDQAPMAEVFGNLDIDRNAMNGFIDQQSYLQGASWINSEYNFFEKFYFLDQIGAYVGGNKGFYLFVATAFDFFGNFVLSPIFLTILLLAISSIFFSKIVNNFDCPNNYKIFILYFYCLNPELNAWSSFFVLRDSIITALTVFFIYSLFYFINNRNIPYLLSLIASLILLSSFRYHLGIIMFALTGLILFILLESKKTKFLIFTTLMALLFFKINELILVTSFLISKLNLLGPFKMLLSPLPSFLSTFNSGYSFLYPGMFINYLLVFFIPLGIYGSFRYNKKIGYILILMFCSIIFTIGMFDNVAGPRQRLNLLVPLIIFQSFGIMLFFNFLKNFLKHNNLK